MPKKILDIGVGQTPYFIRYQLPLNEADEYVGFDACADCLADAKKKIFDEPNVLPVPKILNFVQGDAALLPFANQNFNEVVLSNVLSAPIHWGWNKFIPEHTIKGFGKEDLFYTSRKKVIDEALRVLYPKGRLLIYTDLIIYGQHSYEQIISELQNDKSLVFEILAEEQKRVDLLNCENIKSGTRCYCFMADLLPKSFVYQVTKA